MSWWEMKMWISAERILSTEAKTEKKKGSEMETKDEIEKSPMFPKKYSTGDHQKWKGTSSFSCCNVVF